MTNINETIPVFELNLSKGNDLVKEFVYTVLLVDDDGEPILDGDGKKQYVEDDYPPDTAVHLIVDTHPVAQVFVGDIDGSIALVVGDYKVTDTISAGLAWRMKIIYSDGLDKVGAQGRTLRDA